MTNVFHESFTIERTFDASVGRVFKAFADPLAKARWFSGPQGWQALKREFDFRTGGQEIAHGQFPGGTETLFSARYNLIVPNERLIYVYDMHVNKVLISVSLATLDFISQGDKTTLRVTEQGAYFDDKDANDARREGMKFLLEQIAPHMPD
jgi:uncharacterized protein YndB with AHSA1/START domain